MTTDIMQQMVKNYKIVLHTIKSYEHSYSITKQFIFIVACDKAIVLVKYHTLLLCFLKV